MGEIDISEFKSIDLRVAKVISAEKIEKSNKLLKLTVDIGDGKRTIVSGIAKDYTPEELVGKKIIIIANLKHSSFFGIESQGMLLAASDGDKISLLTIDKDIKEGSKVS